jgi:predicted transcriptional regulator
VPEPADPLSRRERQIMDVLFRLQKATASEVLAELADPPSYSAVRAHLRVLEEKGHVRHEQDGTRYVYAPTLSKAKARRSALKSVVSTFFDGSPEAAMAALLDVSRADLTRDELDRMAALIEQARKEGR